MDQKTWKDGRYELARGTTVPYPVTEIQQKTFAIKLAEITHERVSRYLSTLAPKLLDFEEVEESFNSFLNKSWRRQNFRPPKKSDYRTYKRIQFLKLTSIRGLLRGSKLYG